MTHLRIILNTESAELVNGSVIEKLYEMAKSILDYKAEHLNDTDYTILLEGTLNVDTTYQDYIDYLTGNDTITELRRFPNLTITATQIALRFADSNMLNALLANNIGSNGMITLTLASAVGSFSLEMFMNNTSILSFNELPKFTNVHAIPNKCFKGCSSLTAINLSNITSIGNEAFGGSNLADGCSSLTSIDLSNCTSIGQRSFCNCTALTSIDLSNVSSIDFRAFDKCTALTTVSNWQLSVMKEGMFSNCSSLTTITGLNNITEIASQGFHNCTSLTSIVLPSCTILRLQAFGGCSNLTKIILPSIEYIYHFSVLSAGNGCIIDLGPNAINIATSSPPPQNGKLILRKQGVVNIEDYNNRGFHITSWNTCTVYVPSAYINDYKAATYWSQLGNGQIVALEGSPYESTTWYQ